MRMLCALVWYRLSVWLEENYWPQADLGTDDEEGA